MKVLILHYTERSNMNFWYNFEIIYETYQIYWLIHIIDKSNSLLGIFTKIKY